MLTTRDLEQGTHLLQPQLLKAFTQLLLLAASLILRTTSVSRNLLVKSKET